jgi:hypothetical protein
MKLFFILLITSLIVLTGCQDASIKYEEVEKCLREKGVEKYGVEWCPVCAKQKKLFGSELEGIYIECADEPQRCLDENVDGYPTWKFPDGTVHKGLLQPEDLADMASCNCECTGEKCNCGI